MEKVSKRVVRLLITLLMLYLFFFQPIPLYIEQPGNTFSLNNMIEVAEKYSTDDGDFYITTVGIQQATPFRALTSFLPYHDLMNREEVFGEIQDFDEYDIIQQFHMDSSINTAIQVAFEQAEYDYSLTYNGVYVLQVLDNSSFYSDLKIGDIIKSIDDIVFENSKEFIDYIGNKSVGDTISIDYERKGEEYKSKGELIALENGMAGIGIALTDHTTLKTDPSVRIHSGHIGGPSAGLMFSLQIYNQLIDENLRGNHKIAGTGTINSDGSVGRIGGISKKVVSAHKKEIDYFFAPMDEILDDQLQTDKEIKSNYEEALETAERIETDMKIIPVKNISDAIEFLETLKEEQTKDSEQKHYMDKVFYPSLKIAI